MPWTQSCNSLMVWFLRPHFHVIATDIYNNWTGWTGLDSFQWKMEQMKTATVKIHRLCLLLRVKLHPSLQWSLPWGQRLRAYLKKWLQLNLCGYSTHPWVVSTVFCMHVNFVGKNEKTLHQALFESLLKECFASLALEWLEEQLVWLETNSSLWWSTDNRNTIISD